MTDKEVLEKALERAIENGWDYVLGSLEVIPRGNGMIQIVPDSMIPGSYQEFIFDHEFAKAFWNERGAICPYCGKMCENCRVEDFMPLEYWKYHLQQMVLRENPINYLRKFIKDE